MPIMTPPGRSTREDCDSAGPPAVSATVSTSRGSRRYGNSV